MDLQRAKEQIEKLKEESQANKDRSYDTGPWNFEAGVYVAML